jgi:hypothetical protein
VTILSTIMGVESSGGHNITQGNIGDINNRTGDLAQGYFQITGGTWSQFGGGATGYNSALAAPYATQVQIAQNIPVSRWGPDTQAALGAAGYFPQRGETLGQMMSRYGEDPSATTAADGSTVTGSGSILADGPPSAGGVGSSLTMDPNSPNYGDITNIPVAGVNAPASGSTSGGVSQPATTAQPSTSTLGSDVGQGTPLTQGLQQGTLTAIQGWITNIESSFGSGLAATLKAAATGLGTYFGSVQNWFTRAFLIIVGLVILAVALVALMWDHGGKETAQQVVRVAAV